jgi:hypothetical protein
MVADRARRETFAGAIGSRGAQENRDIFLANRNLLGELMDND